MNEHLLRQSDLHLRLHLHALVPLHEGLVDALCRSGRPPFELSTVLEDIGQRYMRMAEAVNGEIIRHGLLDKEPDDPEDFAEARIAHFTAELLARAGFVVFQDGGQVDARAALEASPVVGDAIRSAMLLARGRGPHQP